MRLYHPNFGGVVRVHRTLLSDDPDTAVAETIAQMAAYARADSEAGSIRDLARQLAGANLDETRFRIWNWLRARVRFVPDRRLAEPVPDHGNVSEVLIRPIDLIRMPEALGDCDDFAMLGAALARAAGLPVVFVTVAADAKAPDQFSHVYLEVAGQAFDASHGPYLGWEVANRFGKRVRWSVETGMPILPLRSGLSGLGQCPEGYQLAEGGAVCLPSPGGYTAPPTTTTSTAGFWDKLFGQSIGTGLNILQARYGVPPEGTLIQTREGVISRTGATPGSFGVQLSTPPSFATAAIPIWVWIVAALAFVMIFAMRGRK